MLRGICQDHPFADGNKRTAIEAADTFLVLNGKTLLATPDAMVGFVLAVAQGERSVDEIAAWLRAHAKDYPHGSWMD